MAELSTSNHPAAHRTIGLLASLLDRLPRSRPTLAVLTYHRVAPAGSRPDLHATLHVELAAFRDQVRLVVDRATPVSIDDVLAAVDGRAELPPRAVLLTFDDGYAEFEEHAWPVLRHHDVPATMFVPTRFPDRHRSFWWDRLSAAVHGCPSPTLTVGHRRCPIGSDAERSATFTRLRAEVAGLPHAEAMELVDAVAETAQSLGAPPTPPATSSWDGLRSMASEGLHLGAHTRNHPFLDRVEPEVVDDEISGSIADLAREAPLGARPAFAYPSGAFDDRVVEVTGRHVPLAFTTERGVLDLAEPDWLRVPRINVGSRATTPLVHLQLVPGCHTARSIVRSLPRGSTTTRTLSSEGTPWS